MSNEQRHLRRMVTGKLSLGGGALSALLGLVNLTGHTDRLGAAGKRIATVDEDRGGAMESDSLRCLGRVDALVVERHLLAGAGEDVVAVLKDVTKLRFMGGYGIVGG